MPSAGSQALMAAGVLTALASLAHLACIVLGAPAYRAMGAGERMARAAAAGRPGPAVVTLAIALVLAAWAAYAFSGAGLLAPLPYTGVVLPAVAAVLLARAIGFPLLRPAFPGNSTTFWWVSSGLCLVLGLLFAAGSLAAR